MDRLGTDPGYAVAWVSSMWWLTLIDGPVPIGDIIFVVGTVVVVAAVALEASDDIAFSEFEGTYAGSGYQPPSPDDDDDDYYDDDDNFSKREKIGKSKGKAPASNQKQNDDFDYVVKKTGIKPEKVRPFHDAVTGKGYSKQELFAVAETFLSIIIIFFG